MMNAKPVYYIFLSVHLFIDILLVGNILHDVQGPVQSLRITVRNFESELIFHCHYDLHMVQGVQAQVVDEVGFGFQLERD